MPINRNLILMVVGFVGVLVLAFLMGYFGPFKVLWRQDLISQRDQTVIETLEQKFARLSKTGNSSCSGSFKTAIPNLPDGELLQGSCCSPMNFHRYSEQIEGLKAYSQISEIPPDPYDISAGLAKKLMTYYDLTLAANQQAAYDYAMANSDEKGPCCCKCWRWYVYGGLGKLLIQHYGFNGEQLTAVWNLSDGCGGADDHLHA